jgi:putative spermidine/putrescine transport system permease protein
MTAPRRSSPHAARARRAAARTAVRATVIGTVLVLLYAPLLIVIAASFDYGERPYVVFPPEKFSIGSYLNIPATQYSALGLSVMVGICAALGACLVGIPAAIGLVRGNMPGKALIMTLFRVPLQIPHVVMGLAFLQAYYAIGNATGLYANGSFIGLVVAHVFAATPLVVGALVPVLQRFNGAVEEAALTLGATRWRTFRRVTLPILAPGIFAGGLYAFMISFGDVPIAIFLTVPGTTTFPVEVFLSLEQEFEPTLLASSSMVIVLSFGILLLIQKLAGLDVFVRR